MENFSLWMTTSFCDETVSLFLTTHRCMCVSLEKWVNHIYVLQRETGELAAKIRPHHLEWPRVGNSDERLTLCAGGEGAVPPAPWTIHPRAGFIVIPWTSENKIKNTNKIYTNHGAKFCSRKITTARLFGGDITRCKSLQSTFRVHSKRKREGNDGRGFPWCVKWMSRQTIIPPLLLKNPQFYFSSSSMDWTVSIRWILEVNELSVRHHKNGSSGLVLIEFETRPLLPRVPRKVIGTWQE